MKSLFITALTLLAVLGYAQEAAKPAPSFKRLYIGVSTTQGVSYRLLSRNTDVGAADGLENLRDEIIRTRNEREKPGYATNAGFRFGVNATKWFSIETGMEYGYRTYGEKTDSLTYGAFWDGNTYQPIFGSGKIRYTYHYVDIPVAFSFTLGKKKVRTLISAGTYFDLLFKRSTKTYITTVAERKPFIDDNTALFKSFNISPFLGIGINYQVNSLMSLRVMPMVQFQILRNYNYSPITERLYSGGINLALNFGFINVAAKSESKE